MIADDPSNALIFDFRKFPIVNTGVIPETGIAFPVFKTLGGFVAFARGLGCYLLLGVAVGDAVAAGRGVLTSKRVFQVSPSRAGFNCSPIATDLHGAVLTLNS
jgi:hypothetical protein